MAFAGLLIYLVILFIRPGDWVKPVLNWPFEFVILGAVGAMSVVQAQAAGKGTRMPHRVFILGWLLAVLLSNLAHGDLSSAITESNAVGKRVIIFLIFLYAIDSVSRLKQVLITMISLIALLGIQGLYQIQNDGIGWAGQPMYWGERIRWIGLWDGANVLSLVFVFSFAFILEFTFGNWGWLTKLFAIVSGGLVLTGLYLAKSRGGLVALFVVILFYFRSKIGNKGLVLGTALVAVLFTVGPSRLQDMNDLEGPSNDASSSRHRVDMWTEGLEMLKYNPVFGIGQGQFLQYTGSLIGHNTFIQVMGETGLVGLFFFVGMLYLSFKSLSWVMRMEDVSFHLASMARALLVCLIGYLSAAFFITAAFELLYILMALAAATWLIARRETGLPAVFPLDKMDLKNIVLLEVGVVMGMYAITAGLSVMV